MVTMIKKIVWYAFYNTHTQTHRHTQDVHEVTHALVSSIVVIILPYACVLISMFYSLRRLLLVVNYSSIVVIILPYVSVLISVFYSLRRLLLVVNHSSMPWLYISLVLSALYMFELSKGITTEKIPIDKPVGDCD